MGKITFHFIGQTRRNESKEKKLRLKPFSLAVSALLLIISIACSKDPGAAPEPTTVAVSSIKLSRNAISLSVGETVVLTATVSPENASDKSVTWTSSDPNVATVADGKVSAIATGSATITARCGNVEAKCAVTVSPIEITAIQISKTAVSLSVGETVVLTATVSPENASDKSVTWTSSDPNVATVADGKVSAIATGSATITARCGNVEAKCAVTVSPIEITAIQISKTAVSLSVGETVVLTATVSPENASDKSVTWTSSDPNVATVADGKVSAIATGSATITARCGNVEAKCAVTVSPIEITAIQISKTAVSLSVGETVVLTATVSPENASDKSVTWTSSNPNVATVADGKVTAIATGSATITAKSNNGLHATCRIAVVSRDVPPGGSEGTGEEDWEK